MDYLMAVPFTLAFNYRPSRILAAGGGSCLMLQLSFSGPKCPQLNCASLAEQKKSTRWMRWMLPKKNECPPEKGAFWKDTSSEPAVNFWGDVLVFRGAVFWSSLFGGLSRKKKVTSYCKKYGGEEISVPSNTFPTHSDLWAQFPPKNGSSRL